MIEVGFKIAIALISLNIVIRTINSLSGIGMVILVSLMIVLLYLINTENMFISAVAYIALCISISITYRPMLYHSFRKPLYYIEKTTLHLIPTILLLLVLHNHPILLVLITAIAIILILIMELRVAPLFNAGNLNLCLSKNTRNVFTRIGLIPRFIGILSNRIPTKIKSTTMHFISRFLKLMDTLTRIENSVSKPLYKVPEIAIILTQNIVKIEKYAENTFHRIAEAVETLQHKMEHSFILLLFLMGLLLLIAIIFYILLITI